MIYARKNGDSPRSSKIFSQFPVSAVQHSSKHPCFAIPCCRCSMASYSQRRCDSRRGDARSVTKACRIVDSLLIKSCAHVGSRAKYWFKCPAGPDHEWSAFVYSRTSGDASCPFCAGHKASVTNSLATQFPTVAAQWHSTRNGNVTPDAVVAGRLLLLTFVF